MNEIFTQIAVDGTEFALKWQDFGSYRKLNVFQGNRLVGSKKFPIKTDTGEGVIAYTIRSLLRAKEHGQIH